MLPEYHEIDRWTVRGHTVIGVACPQDSKRGQLLDTIGRQVLIDGTKYSVKGVEAYCIENIRKGMPVGLIVDQTP